MSDLDILRERNSEFRANYEGGLTIALKLSTLILTRADARIDPAHFLRVHP